MYPVRPAPAPLASTGWKLSSRPGPQVRDHTQSTQLITLGRACAVVPESLRAQLLDDHATVPVLDAPAVTTVIAWPPHSRSKAIADLVRTAIGL
ncbi:hypothetical protein [Nocardia sp. A7]|uniref:hypothetical protein n=1 Tax=Nocardia sp. A7 TaxID=2789274 RepID=UPI00397AB104